MNHLVPATPADPRSARVRRPAAADPAGHAQVVETYVSYLRRKLDRLGPPLIHTRRGAGYTLRSPESGSAGSR